MQWTKKQAIKELDDLIQQIGPLREKHRGCADHVRWAMRTTSFLEEVFGKDSKYFQSFDYLPWGKIGGFFIGGPNDWQGVFEPQAAIEREHQQAYIEQLDSAKGILQAAQDHLKRVDDLDSVYEGKDTGPEASTILKIINLAERSLRKTMREPPKNEKEVQDRFEDLLNAREIKYSREKERIKYSTKTYINDFTLEKLDLAIDLKFCARAGREREIIQEINDYIMAFRTQYGNLLFIVYDVGQIQDVDQFVSSFEAHPNVVVLVVKH